MKITHVYHWTEHGTIPRGCRKPRDMTRRGELTVEVAEVTPEQAPVAFRVLTGITDRAWKDLHWLGGKLWERHLPWAYQTEDSIAGSHHFPSSVLGPHSHYGSPEEAAERLAEWAAGYLIIDSVVYREAGEPRYYIQTFGLGGNHGGTGLFVDYDFRSDVQMCRYFTAAQFEQARAAAIAVALDRGDTRDAERYVTSEPEIELLLPEAQTLVIPNTYGVTVEYTECVTLEVVGSSEEDAREEATRRVREDNLAAIYAKRVKHYETARAIHVAQLTVQSVIDRARLDT